MAYKISNDKCEIEIELWRRLSGKEIRRVTLISGEWPSPVEIRSACYCNKFNKDLPLPYFGGSIHKIGNQYEVIENTD